MVFQRLAFSVAFNKMSGKKQEASFK